MNDVLINSEQSVLGALIRDNNSFDEIQLKEHEFISEAHQVIYKAISDLLTGSKPADVITLAEHLQAIGKLEFCGELRYLSEITQSAPSPKNIKHYANIVSSSYKRRRIKELCVNLSELVESKKDIDYITETAERELFNLLEERNAENEMVHIKEAVVEAIEWDDSEKQGLATGLRDLDRITNGFSKSDLIIIAGRPSMGKSAFAMQIAEHVANKNPVLVFSLEMSKRQIAQRMLRYHSAIIEKSQAMAHLFSLKMHIDDSPAVTIQHIRSRCRREKRKNGLSMIVVDYLQLMRGVGNSRTEEIGSISRGLKSLAKEFNVPVVALSQLSRKVDDRSDNRPIMSDLRDSGEIEQDADVIIFIYREEKYNEDTENKGIAEIICRKNRNGNTGTIDTQFNGELTRFYDFDGQKVTNIKRQRKGFTVS